MARFDWRPNLAEPEVQTALSPREAVYFNLISYCRHIGLHVKSKGNSFWVARVRRKDGGYTQERLGPAWIDDLQVTSYETALEAANDWFNRQDVAALAADPYQFGSRQDMTLCPIGPVHTVGHALRDYIAWKRNAATQSHFESIVNCINYHLVPRIAFIPIEEFNARHFQDLVQDVLTTPKKTGRDTPKRRLDLFSMSDEQLRTRKKTVNTLVSILRGAFELAWERSDLDSDRPLRCLRRLPNIDRPRIIFLSRDECRSLLHACRADLRNLVQAALFTGCRANELFQMRVGDVLPEQRSIYVSSPKGRRRRYVYLPPEGCVFFSALVGQRPTSDRLFLKQNGRAWGSEYKTYFQRARQESGLSHQLTFHGLRHTYASQLIQNGASMAVVAAQLGHATTQTVSATYAHLAAFHQESEIGRCFEPIGHVDTTSAHRTGGPQNMCTDNGSASLSIFWGSSWPRANHSRFNGDLLTKLRRRPDGR